MSQFAVILAAAGRSSRFGDALKKKPYVDLQGKPIWLRALEAFTAHSDHAQSIIVVSADDLDWFKEKYRPNLAFLDVQVIAGGAERANSVERGLLQVATSTDFVAVHDAARPLITREWVDLVFKAAQKTGAAIPAAPIRGTIKRVNQGNISETVPREGLWEAQTPQFFRRELLIDAYANRGGFTATDEAQLLERMGHPVAIVECSPMNIKITTQEDLRIAQALLGALPKGKGLRPIHPFANEKPDLLGRFSPGESPGEK